jgi:D-alanyl-D-alanine carboxypeptidase (penicillin-binding protein 5/6)
MNDGRLLLQGGRMHRAAREAQARRARRRRRLRNGLITLGLGVTVLLAFMATSAFEPGPRTLRSGGARSAGRPSAVARAQPVRSAYGITPASVQVQVRLKLGLRSGLLFDVRSGRVLWQRDGSAQVPIASLTKMMTALVVVAHARPSELVKITRAAVQFSGSGVGLLPLGKRVRLETLLYGLLLPSGNDAAIALAQHVAGTEARFVAMMNQRAAAMGLRCTHFTSVSGIVDQRNYSCTADLAVLAHAVLSQPLLGRIVATPSAVLPFPIKGGKLYLYNNNPLLRLGYPGTDGVKTGYTVASGPCLVVSARRGRRWLGAVLLHSADVPDQAQALLNAGFATRGA